MLFYKRAIVEFFERLAKFPFVVHHDRSVPCDGFADRLSENRRKLRELSAVVTTTCLAVIEENKAFILDYLISSDSK